eukprot:7026921-Prymnesium_polylepis.1
MTEFSTHRAQSTWRHLAIRVAPCSSSPQHEHVYSASSRRLRSRTFCRCARTCRPWSGGAAGRQRAATAGEQRGRGEEGRIGAR